MTAPRNATTARGGKRFYTWRDSNYWSVTTILSGGVPKPALLPWGIKAVATGAVTKRDVLGAMLAECKTPDVCARGVFCEACDQTVRWLKSTPYAQRDRAANLGSLVHDAAEAHALRRPYPTWDEQVRPYMEGFVSFLDDFAPVFTATEASVYNRSERYAGTLDAIVDLQLPLHSEPGRYILDTKSGKGIYPEIGLQLAAYRFAEFIGLPDGSEAAMPTVDGALGLHLTPEGYRLIEVRADEEIFRAFLYAREVFRFVEETSKTVLGLDYSHDGATEAAVA